MAVLPKEYRITHSNGETEDVDVSEVQARAGYLDAETVIEHRGFKLPAEEKQAQLDAGLPAPAVVIPPGAPAQPSSTP